MNKAAKHNSSEEVGWDGKENGEEIEATLAQFQGQLGGDSLQRKRITVLCV